MLSERHAEAVVVRAPAKVNLFLEVLAKRADGYHEIVTLIIAVSLYDTLEFKEETSGQILLRCDQAELSTGPENLVCRAAEMLRQHTGCVRGARIRLAKRIPMAAGLAGGSTDAAAALAGLNRLWGLGLRTSELAELGGALGSDVPFFFSTPAAWCTGRGEKVTPVNLGRTLHLVLACPPVGLATADVYRGVAVPERPESGAEVRQAVIDGNVEEIGRRLFNRLQPAAERLCPDVAALQARLTGLRVGPGGPWAAMSGSGSTLFALCRGHADALRLARDLRNQQEERTSSGDSPGGGWKRLRVFVVQSCF
jgi:4-diphosphocytidyl-2-C-methyl-D-erythritol kinase